MILVCLATAMISQNEMGPPIKLWCAYDVLRIPKPEDTQRKKTPFNINHMSFNKCNNDAVVSHYSSMLLIPTDITEYNNQIYKYGNMNICLKKRSFLLVVWLLTNGS